MFSLKLNLNLEELVEVPVGTLLMMKRYIEYMTLTREQEHGTNRKLEELIANHSMPQVYDLLMQVLNSNK